MGPSEPCLKGQTMQQGLFTIFIPGKPVTQGSKKGVYNPKAKRVWVKDQNSEDLGNWRNRIASEVRSFMKNHNIDGLPKPEPVKLALRFSFMRPKGHFGTGKNTGNLKPSAPSYFTKAPDLAKLARAVEDAMTGIVYQDDSQICREELSKHYTEDFTLEGVEITVFKLR